MAPSSSLPMLQALLLIVFFFFFFSSSSHASAESSDVLLLLSKIKTSLQGPVPADGEPNLQLSSWNHSLPLCQWRGLKWALADGTPVPCSEQPHRTNRSLSRDPSLQLLSIQLPASGLAGSIPKEIGELSSLQSLLLPVNSLAGPLPLELGNCPALAALDLGENTLNGSLPASLWNLCDRLVTLRLHGNHLSGPLPEPALPNATCDRLRLLDLGNNRFEGQFPGSLEGLKALRELDLGSNHFSGPIPASLAEIKGLERLNLSHNNFTGPLPPFGGKFGADAFQGNGPGLCGPPLGKCPGGRPKGLSSGAIAGIVIGLMAGVVVAASVTIGYVQGRKRKCCGKRGEEEEEYEEEMDETKEGEDGAGRRAGEGKLLVFQGGEHLTLEDVLNATGQVMEKTTYGTVYKAKLADGGTIALRLLREGSCKERAECLPEIRQLGRARHENLVALRAFFQGQRGEKLLIYDYVPSKSLHDLLHETIAGRPLLNWPRRHKIALGIARGLAHLHTGMDAPITHGNVRSKNVLVDETFVPRLTEYGLHKLMVPAVADELAATAKTDGYRAPELQRMSKCCARTDVYAFGILLLEILMGRRPGKDDRTGQTADLPTAVKAAVLEETTMEVFDVEVLKGVRNPMEDGMLHALKLAMGCCAPASAVRPDIGEVVRQLEENRPRNRSALYSPTDRSEIGTPF